MLNLAVPLAPLSLIMVFMQTSPFWVSILAYCLLSEPIYRLEIVAMLICFGAVVTIAMQVRKAENAADTNVQGALDAYSEQVIMDSDSSDSS